MISVDSIRALKTMFEMNFDRKLIAIGFILLLSLLSCNTSTENNKFLPSANLNLKLDAPVNNWDEALPLGNGILGGLLWGSHDTLRISLDRGDL